MKHWKILLLITSLIVLSGCANNSAYHSGISNSAPGTIQACGRSFSVEDINAGIMDAINNTLYYQQDETFYNFLNAPLEYELFYDPNHGYPGPEVYFIIANSLHPLSTAESPMLYRLGITITDNGLQSYFSRIDYISSSEDISAYSVEGGTYLGHHTALLNNILTPVHEEISEQWKFSAEEALRRYMDENDFYGDKHKNLPKGNYSIYIKGFSKADTDSVVIFIHEDGHVYEGRYYFVHEISEDSTATLNHVELVENVDASYLEYLKKVQHNAALCMEYRIE